MELPGWNFEENYNLSTNRRSTRPQDELVELLWRDGQVVLKSQTHRDQTQNQTQTQSQNQTQSPKQNHHHQETLRSNIFLEHQESVSWIQYPPDENPFETDDLSSRFFSTINPFERSTTETVKHESCLDLPQVMPPPKFMSTDSSLTGNKELGMEQYSVTTFGPSHCGSNQSQNDLDVTMSDVVHTYKTNIDEKINYSNAASSSGGSSGCSFGKNIKEITISGGKSITIDRKRKNMIDTDDQSVSQSDAMGNNKSNQRSGSTRRSRAAEVHNLSERRRRDRINEKMRTLQELIPQCSKTDKASILDEAIDYLKSLQLQLQVMWMNRGMAAAATAVPMMFPGVQPPPLIHQMQMQNPVQFPQFPVMDRSAIQNNPGLVCPNPVQNQMFSDRFARYIGGFPQMQAASQAMEMLRFGSPGGQGSQSSVPTKTTDGPLSEK